jgi:hypothetical protein
MGLSWLGATCWRFCIKTQKEPAKCLYSVLYTVYSVLLSPLWLKSVPGWPAISVSTWQQSRVGQIVWFGWLSAISQLSSRVGEREGEWGNFVSIALHSLSLPGPGGESREGGCVPSPCTQSPRIDMQRIYRSMLPWGLNFRLPFDERLTLKNHKINVIHENGEFFSIILIAFC